MNEQTTAHPTFDTLGLNEALLSAIKDLGYDKPTLIQSNVIPYMLTDRDVLGQAQTGTGKTAAFALPLLQKIDLNADCRMPQVLVLTPTRELAIQVSEAFQCFAKNLGKINVAAIYGGQAYDRQIRALKGGVEVVVGTAGRIMDHMRRGILKLDQLQSLVLDEADEMLRMGFIDDVRWILSYTPSHCQRALFSATMPQDVVKIVNDYLRQPCKVQVKSKTVAANTIDQRFVVVKGLTKQAALDRLLEVEDVDGVLVFVNTKRQTMEVADALKASGKKAIGISGDVAQNQREDMVNHFKSGKVDVLVATDVVARGLDVDRITHVINYDLPQNHESYIHRIGRTGRAGRTGSAIALVYPKDLRLLKMVERTAKCKIVESQLPSAQAVTEKRVATFKREIAEIIRHKNLAKFKEMMLAFQAEYGTDIEDTLAALALMAQQGKTLFVPEAKPAPEKRERLSREQTGKRQSSTGEQTMYHINVGRRDQVHKKTLLEHLQQDAKISRRRIGQIRLYDRYTLLEIEGQEQEAVVKALQRLDVVPRPVTAKVSQ